jgi:hypothetical protein
LAEIRIDGLAFAPREKPKLRLSFATWPMPPDIVSHGSLCLNNKRISPNSRVLDRVDLDAGKRTVEGPDGIDFSVIEQNDKTRAIIPLDGVRIGLSERVTGKQGCLLTDLSNSELVLDMSSPATKLCARTSDGNISEMRAVQSRDPGSKCPLRLDFITWAHSEQGSTAQNASDSGAPIKEPVREDRP